MARRRRIATGVSGHLSGVAKLPSEQRYGQPRYPHVTVGSATRCAASLFAPRREATNTAIASRSVHKAPPPSAAANLFSSISPFEAGAKAGAPQSRSAACCARTVARRDRAAAARVLRSSQDPREGWIERQRRKRKKPSRSPSLSQLQPSYATLGRPLRSHRSAADRNRDHHPSPAPLLLP